MKLNLLLTYSLALPPCLWAMWTAAKNSLGAVRGDIGILVTVNFYLNQFWYLVVMRNSPAREQMENLSHFLCSCIGDHCGLKNRFWPGTLALFQSRAKLIWSYFLMSLVKTQFFHLSISIYLKYLKRWMLVDVSSCKIYTRLCVFD